MSDEIEDGEPLVVQRWADAEALAAIVSDHAAVIRDVYEWHDYASDAFGVSHRALEAIRDQPRDEDAFELVYGDQGDLAIIYEACEYVVEGDSDARKPGDWAVARRLYRRLGGETDVSAGSSLDPDAASP